MFVASLILSGFFYRFFLGVPATSREWAVNELVGAKSRLFVYVDELVDGDTRYWAGNGGFGAERAAGGFSLVGDSVGFEPRWILKLLFLCFCEKLDVVLFARRGIRGPGVSVFCVEISRISS